MRHVTYRVTWRDSEGNWADAEDDLVSAADAAEVADTRMRGDKQCVRAVISRVEDILTVTLARRVRKA